MTRRERERREREHRYETWLVRDLIEKAGARRDAIRIRQFLDDLERGRSDLRDPTDHEWIEWVRKVADKMDPLSGGQRPSEPLQMPDSWTQDDEPGRSTQPVDR